MKAHAALMDEVYRRQRHIYDLTRKYYLVGRDRTIRGLSLAPGARLVEIGCGTARNLIRIAKAYPGARLYGLDASAEMLKTAQEAVRRAGLANRIVLAHGLAEELTPARFGEDAFEAVLFSYSLSMIPDWKQALRASEAGLAPGGRLHVVDFGDLKGLPGPGARALRAWLGFFHVTPRFELLDALERTAPSGAGESLHIFPGRYAFILSRDQRPGFGDFNPVVSQSQTPNKTLGFGQLSQTNRGGGWRHSSYSPL